MKVFHIEFQQYPQTTCGMCGKFHLWHYVNWALLLITRTVNRNYVTTSGGSLSHRIKKVKRLYGIHRKFHLWTHANWVLVWIHMMVNLNTQQILAKIFHIEFQQYVPYRSWQACQTCSPWATFCPRHSVYIARGDTEMRKRLFNLLPGKVALEGRDSATRFLAKLWEKTYHQFHTPKLRSHKSLLWAPVLYGD